MTTKTIGPAQLKKVLAPVLERFDVTLDELFYGRRVRHVADARAIASWILREHGLTFQRIGQLLHKDHSSIVHGVRRVELERSLSKAMARELEEMKGAAA